MKNKEVSYTKEQALKILGENKWHLASDIKSSSPVIMNYIDSNSVIMKGESENYRIISRTCFLVAKESNKVLRRLENPRATGTDKNGNKVMKKAGEGFIIAKNDFSEYPGGRILTIADQIEVLGTVSLQLSEFGVFEDQEIMNQEREIEWNDPVIQGDEIYLKTKNKGGIFEGKPGIFTACQIALGLTRKRNVFQPLPDKVESIEQIVPTASLYGTIEDEPALNEIASREALLNQCIEGYEQAQPSRQWKANASNAKALLAYATNTAKGFDEGWNETPYRDLITKDDWRSKQLKKFREVVEIGFEQITGEAYQELYREYNAIKRERDFYESQEFEWQRDENHVSIDSQDFPLYEDDSDLEFEISSFEEPENFKLVTSLINRKEVTTKAFV